MSELTLKKKKEWAKILFTKENLSQKEIAAKVGVSEKTMSKWANDPKEKWESLRTSLIITKEESLRRIYEQIKEINADILTREEGKRYAGNREADTLVKLTSAAKSLETETGISEIIEVFKKFNDWLRTFDLLKAQELIKLQDSFITTRLK